ncbi:hypothetical protein [Pelagerythrobacter marensis]|uniref:hypothetical protein n=1 Tax=Pelagerythrobacter marensis TaxID=543877 RepID=UPI0012379301|nr:hypothetical protein [Pelagerythrobacter marensis]
MLEIILFALFLTVAAISLAVLGDSFVRGREAFARLRHELGQDAMTGSIRVTVTTPATCRMASDGGRESRLRPVSRSAADRSPRSMASARARHPLPVAA